VESKILGGSPRFFVVVLGSEGFGKAAWPKRTVEPLKELDLNAMYFNSMRGFLAEAGLKARGLDSLLALYETLSATLEGALDRVDSGTDEALVLELLGRFAWAAAQRSL